MATASDPPSATNGVKKSTPAEKKYKCQYCNRAFSRSEHRSRHERSRKSTTFFLVSQPTWGTVMPRLCPRGSTPPPYNSPLFTPPFHSCCHKTWRDNIADLGFIPPQTQRKGPTSVVAASRPLSAVIFFFDTIGRCTPKMVRASNRLSVRRVVQRHRPQRRPRLSLPSR